MPETLELAVVEEADINAIVEKCGKDPEAVILILQAIQTRYRYLPSAAIAFRNKEDIEACHTTTWIEL